jgi:oligosaccharide repeat unit polymerase
MGLAILNALLYISALGIYYRKFRRVLDAGFILLAVYTITAVVCVFYYATNPNQWHLILWPFIYLFIICLLAFRPYFKYRSTDISHKLQIRKLKLLNLFCWIYIVCALIDLIFSYNAITNALNADNWRNLYDEHAAGEILLYNNQVERLAKNFTGWLNPLAICSFFYYLTLHKKNWFFLSLLITAIIFPNFSISIVVAARGMTFIFAIKLFLGYIFFENAISKKTKKALTIFAALFFVLFLSYILAVTTSRFDSNSSDYDSKASLLFYFGHSMLTFDYGIADSIEKFMYGDFIFRSNQDLYNAGFDAVLGTHFGTNFFTFVGAWYLDFGPIGTLLIAFLLPILLFGYWRNKQKIDMADLFLYFFYLSWLLNGVAVHGRGYYLQWLMTVIIFTLLKIIRI